MALPRTSALAAEHEVVEAVLRTVQVTPLLIIVILLRGLSTTTRSLELRTTAMFHHRLVSTIEVVDAGVEEEQDGPVAVVLLRGGGVRCRLRAR